MSRVFDPTQTGVNAEVVIAPPNPVYNTLPAFTLAAWVFVPTSSVQTDPAVIIKDPLDPNGNGGAASLAFGNSVAGSPMKTRLNAFAGDSAFAASSSNEFIPLGQWSHLACTFDVNAANKNVRLYINGVECTYLNQFPGALPMIDDSFGGWYIGYDPAESPTNLGLFNGNIAEMVIYNVQLSSAQMATLAASTTGASVVQPANIVGYWHLCGLASPEPDSSGNGNSGVLSVNPPLPGPNSPGYSGCGAPSAGKVVVCIMN